MPVYAVNTLGGIGGLTLTLIWALPTLGLAGASVLALSFNVVVAFAAATMGRTAIIDGNVFSVETIIGDRSLSFLALASGFLVLAAEVVFQHQLAQVLISSYYSSTLVLMLVLAALGLAALAAPWFARLKAHALSIVLGGAALAFALQPVIFIVQRGGIHYIPFEKRLGSYLLEALCIGVPAVALVLLPAGLVFPLLLKRATSQGIDAGRLLAVNGIGDWMGAEVTSRVLMPMFWLWHTMAVVAAGYASSILVCAGCVRWILVPVLGCVIAWTWRLDRRLPYVGLVKGDRVAQVAVGREGVVSILTNAPDDWRLLLNNTYTLGGTRAQSNQERQALLPILLHGGAKRVATLGVATGSTLSGAMMEPMVEEVEGIELSPLVLRAAKQTFAQFNRNAVNDPCVHLTQGDARWVIGQRRDHFDVIVGDLFLPWSTGEGRLFTREHFSGVRAALRPEGIFCQWLPMYQLTQPQFEAIVRTFREVFPDTWILREDFYTSMPIIGLVGGRSLSRLDWTKIAAACERVKAMGICRDPLLRHVEGVAMLVMGNAPSTPSGPVITLANSWLEWNAARNVTGLREPWFIGVPLARYLRGAAQQNFSAVPGYLQLAQRCGDLFLTLEIARASKLPQGNDVEGSLPKISSIHA